MPGESARPRVNPVAPGFTAGGFLFCDLPGVIPEKPAPRLMRDGTGFRNDHAQMV
jgi:hypothetical protein